MPNRNRRTSSSSKLMKERCVLLPIDAGGIQRSKVFVSQEEEERKKERRREEIGNSLPYFVSDATTTNFFFLTSCLFNWTAQGIFSLFCCFLFSFLRLKERTTSYFPFFILPLDLFAFVSSVYSFYSDSLITRQMFVSEERHGEEVLTFNANLFSLSTCLGNPFQKKETSRNPSWSSCQPKKMMVQSLSA